MKKLVLILVLGLGGCCPMRGYKWASHGPGDTSAGDVTHISDPGARVVVPKNPKKISQEKPSARYIMAFHKPESNCVEFQRHPDQFPSGSIWICPARQQ